MASNRTQAQDTENPPPTSTSGTSLNSTETTIPSSLSPAPSLNTCRQQPNDTTTDTANTADSESHQRIRGSKSVERTAYNNGLHIGITSHDHGIPNDTNLIINRRINFDHKARRDLELMCEDKVSKYKLEEVHCSLPSSVKSTFIMTFSPDGQRVASTHGDHRIYICDLNTGKLLDTLEGHPKTPWCLAWHPSNREILASGCLAGEVRVWDLRSKACESWTSDNNTIITSLDFHPKERVLVVATANDIHFWDWSESEPFAKTTTTHDKEKVKFVEFDSSGTKLITGISNLPKFAGYSSDSLQNRIIDSYLTQGTIVQLPTENMTQNSEITSPLTGSLNSNETFNERNATQSNPNIRQMISGTNNNEQDISYRSTLTLSRVAFLYRQLEALEDSMRHTSFSPYVNHQRLIGSSVDALLHRNFADSQQNLERGQESDQSSSNNGTSGSSTGNYNNNINSSFSSQVANSTDTNESPDRIMTRETPPPMQQAPSQCRIDQATSQQQQQQIESARGSTFEPFVVAFDESLEHLQLMPLVVDGQTINFASVVEQFPIDLPYQLHFMMQFESIHQVNQNFIRISKLMSSARLYRQVVQQILTGNSGQGHYQPNQILTAQSASPRSTRRPPIVFRNPMESSGFSRGVTDPIMAIQFRNSARNVPLVTICKIDLLSARSVCIMRTQQLIEQAASSMRSAVANDRSASTTSGNSAGVESATIGDRVLGGNRDSSSLSLSSLANERLSSSEQRNLNNNSIDENQSFYHILNQIHQSLAIINHAPLTTSNVHTHISSMRSLINKLLSILSSLFQTLEEGRRLIGLIHDIAHSLTGRSWNIPLGATLDDIRLDVIHTLCIVDLTLHLTRQVQLLQMQRLCAIARVEESR